MTKLLTYYDKTNWYPTDHYRPQKPNNFRQDSPNSRIAIFDRFRQLVGKENRPRILRTLRKRCDLLADLPKPKSDYPVKFPA